VPSQPAIARLALTVLALAAGASCGRRQLREQNDAGSDSGLPSVGDTGASEAPVVETAADRSPDLASDLATDQAADVGPDTGPDAPPAACPPDVAPLDVYNCARCSGPATNFACYYPALGQSRDTVPNPQLPQDQCATTPCEGALRYECCADPGGPPSPTALYCATNTSPEDMLRLAFTKRDAEECTTIEIGVSSGYLPLVDTPLGLGNARAWRGPCGALGRDPALGGLGAVTVRPMGPGDFSLHYGVHVSLFFDQLSGIARSRRIDLDDIAIPPATGCGSADCLLCAGSCAFDATYRYGFVGGLAAYRDTVVLTPPATYEHIHSPVTTMPPDLTCTLPVPDCGGPAIDTADLMAAFGDADVQLAFTRSLGAGTTPFYGQDPRPVDGQAFQLLRDGGGGFLIGTPCPAGSTPSSCMQIPGGLARLMAVLVAFDQQELTNNPSCTPPAP